MKLKVVVYQHYQQFMVFSRYQGYNCRSTYAKPAARRSPQQRTPQVHLVEVRDSSDNSNLHTNSQTESPTYLIHELI